MFAEIITTGSEFLLGESVDTNSAYIARGLRDAGIEVQYLITVGDDLERMTAVLREALRRSQLIITTGGLGPTVDDVTREAVARAVGRELVFREDLLEDIAAFFARAGRPMSENNRRQAYIPAGAVPIRNPVGTAPAFIVETPSATIICLPGVPREMEYLMQNEVLPYVRRRWGAQQSMVTRTLHTCSVGESTVDSLIGDLESLGNPSVGLAAHAGRTDIRITARAVTSEEARRMVSAMEDEIRRRLGDVIFGGDGETLEGIIARQLTARGYSVAVLETNTAGAVAERLRRALAELGQGRLLVASQVEPPIPADTPSDSLVLSLQEFA
ncbi:MAG: competence/damage-inducible protein A [Anaerolineae bacterium]